MIVSKVVHFENLKIETIEMFKTIQTRKEKKNSVTLPLCPLKFHSYSASHAPHDSHLSV